MQRALHVCNWEKILIWSSLMWPNNACVLCIHNIPGLYRYTCSLLHLQPAQTALIIIPLLSMYGNSLKVVDLAYRRLHIPFTYNWWVSGSTVLNIFLHNASGWELQLYHFCSNFVDNSICTRPDNLGPLIKEQNLCLLCTRKVRYRNFPWLT